MVLVTDEPAERDLLELSLNIPSEGAGVVVVAPAIGTNTIDGALGGDEAAHRQARQRLERSLDALGALGIEAFGEVVAGDPVAAASEALRQYPADEVLIVATARDRSRWLEGGHLDRARETLHAPVRLIGDEDLDQRLSAVPGSDAPAAAGRGGIPRFSEGDLIAITLVLVGAIAGIGLTVIVVVSLLG
jgi:hypothetical protein